MDLTVKSQLARGPAVEFWRNTLARIPTAFGRLVYLSSLRDETTGRYTHEALIRLQGPEDADRTLSNSHQQVFSQWISSSLAEQKRDLDQYVLEVGGRLDSLWPYRNVVPAMAREVERQLYLTDFETLLWLLQFDYNEASAIPGS